MKELLYEEAGKRIFNLRIAKKISREQLAEMADISPKFLYEMENGKKGFSAEILCNIADSLSVKCDYIMHGNLTDYFDEELLTMLKHLETKEMECIKDIVKRFHHFLKE